jgi:hypothetical protein
MHLMRVVQYTLPDETVQNPMYENGLGDEDGRDRGGLLGHGSTDEMHVGVGYMEPPTNAGEGAGVARW